jgi:hypothetical protein
MKSDVEQMDSFFIKNCDAFDIMIQELMNNPKNKEELLKAQGWIKEQFGDILNETRDSTKTN